MKNTKIDRQFPEVIMTDDTRAWFLEMIERCESAEDWSTPTAQEILRVMADHLEISPSDEILDLLGLMVDEIERLRKLIRQWASPRGTHRRCNCPGCQALAEVAEKLESRDSGEEIQAGK